MTTPDLTANISDFRSSYDIKSKEVIWEEQSQRFRKFWKERVLSTTSGAISDDDCDVIIRILDRNGKGNTKDCEAVAKAMVTQRAWRSLFNEFHTDKELGSLFTALLEESDPIRKAVHIDNLYKLNEGRGNSLTGPSGNAVCAFLAAFDPVNNLSIISLKDRLAVIEFLELSLPFDWVSSSIGTRIVQTNKVILDGFRLYGLDGWARSVGRFCYFQPMQALWKGEHTVKLTDTNVSVTIPTSIDDAEDEGADKDSIRESMQMQAMIASIGASMGFTIWLPKADRGRVLKAWQPLDGELVDVLPSGFQDPITKTIEQIDVLWIKNRMIVRAFEVEHTTSIYSGLLRMGDLVALQPNINIKLHIVAPDVKREKVLYEIRRPVFSLHEGRRRLSELCTYLSYSNIKEIGELDPRFLSNLSDEVIDKFEEKAN